MIRFTGAAPAKDVATITDHTIKNDGVVEMDQLAGRLVDRSFQTIQYSKRPITERKHLHREGQATIFALGVQGGCYFHAGLDSYNLARLQIQRIDR